MTNIKAQHAPSLIDLSKGSTIPNDVFAQPKGIRIPRSLPVLGAAVLIATGLAAAGAVSWNHVTRRVDAVGACPPQDQPRLPVTQHPTDSGYRPELDPYVLQTGQTNSGKADTHVGKALTCIDAGRTMLNNKGQETSSLYAQSHPAQPPQSH